MIEHKTNLNLIQVLRGVASLLVVLFHTTANSQEILNNIFLGSFFSFGASGVDIFFVLSGFIITYTASKNLEQPAKMLPFIRKRIVRIFPTYWIIITLFLFIQLALPSFYKTHYPFTGSNMCSTFLLLPGHIMVNGVSWTLSYELFFYALFSLAFLLPDKKIFFLLLILYSLLIIIIPLLGFNGAMRNNWANLVFHPMNIEFFMGVLAAVLIPRIPRALSLPLVITGACIFLADGIFTDLKFQLLPGDFNRVIIFGIPSFLVIAGLVTFELSNRISVHNILLSLGEASYSLYLLHLPIIAAGLKMIAKFNIQNNIILHMLLILMIGMICFASVVFYNWVEKPIITRLNELGKRERSLKT